MKRFLNRFIQAITLVIILHASSGMAVLADTRAGKWSKPQVIFALSKETKGVCRYPQIAILRKSIHAVWRYGDNVYWSRTNTNGSWSKPVVIFSNQYLSGNPHIYSDGAKIFLVSDSLSEIKFRCYDGDTWSKEETVLEKMKESVRNPKIVVSGGKVYVFWLSHQNGIMVHSRGSTRLRYSVRVNKTWSKPVSIPKATNADQFNVTEGPSGKIKLAWIQIHFGFMEREFTGLTKPSSPKLTMEATSYDTLKKKWSKPEMLGTWEGLRGLPEPRIAVSPSGVTHVLWGEYYGNLTPARFFWRSREGGKWGIKKQILMGGNETIDIAIDQNGKVIIAAPGITGRRRLAVLLNAGTPQAVIHEAPPGYKMRSGDLRMAVSPKGVVHLTGRGRSVYYCNFSLDQ